MEDRIDSVVAPVLLLGAAADPFAMPDVERLASHLTSAASVETVVLPEGTVASVEQLPEAVAAAVLPFLARTIGASA
jgi:pimeloyl-ACP methyl ester carboxylesterase